MSGDPDATTKLIHFDEERGTLVYHVGETTEEELHQFETKMAEFDIGIKVTNGLLLATPKSIEGSVITPEMEHINGIMKSLNIADISIDPGSEYAKAQDALDEMIAKQKLRGEEGSADIGKGGRKRISDKISLTGAQSLDNTPQTAKKGGARYSRDGKFINYNDPWFNLKRDGATAEERQLNALVTLYTRGHDNFMEDPGEERMTPDERKEAKKEFLNWMREDISDIVANAVESTTEILQIDGHVIRKHTISISAILHIANYLDDLPLLSRDGTPIPEDDRISLLHSLRNGLAGWEVLYKVVGAIVSVILKTRGMKESKASWMCLSPDNDKIIVSETNGPSYKLDAFGVDSNWKAVNPFGREGAIKIAKIVTHEKRDATFQKHK